MEKLEQNRQKYLKIIKNFKKQGTNYQKCQKSSKILNNRKISVKNIENGLKMSKKTQKNRQKNRKIIKNVEKQGKNYQKYQKIIKNIE